MEQNKLLSLVFLIMCNCAWKPGFLKSSHICACLTSKIINMHNLSPVLACAMCKTPEMHARNYIRMRLKKLNGVHILSHVITSTRAACKLPKNSTEMSTSPSVKFRLSSIVRTYIRS